MADGKKKPLARSLGEFFGILWDAAKTDVSKPPAAPAVVVRKDVQEKTVETPSGPLTLRRTTIDEVERAGRGQIGEGSGESEGAR